MGLKNRAGFTIVEILVMVFIILLISGSVIIGYGKSRENYYVMKASQKMTADLRRAQNMALSGKSQGGVTPQGYGLYFQSASQYLLFYNANSSKVYDGSSVVLETVVLDKVGLFPIDSSVFFVPPDPTTYINGAASGSVVFTLNGGSFTKTITVYAVGRIEID